MLTKTLSTKRIGLQALADSLGLNPATVSRALNNRYGVKAATRTRILEAAREMGYLPNEAARRLKAHPTLRLGLFFAPFVSANQEVNPTAINLIEKVSHAVQADGMAINIIFFTNNDDLKGQVELHNVDVAICYGDFSRATFQALHDLGLPAIILQTKSDLPNQISLLQDTYSAGFRAIEYLAALGHERIGLVTGPLSTFHSEGLRKGMEAALDVYHLRLHDEWMIELGKQDTNKDGAFREVSRLLALDHLPTALLFGSDWLALGGIQAARERGLKLPDDLNIIGYDNLPVAAEIIPTLTTFDWNQVKIAETISGLSSELGKHKWSAINCEAREILMSPELIKRQSCHCLRQWA